jgi:hypothetical protein
MLLPTGNHFSQQNSRHCYCNAKSNLPWLIRLSGDGETEMSIMEFVIALQNGGDQPQAGSQSAEGYAWYFVLGILALVLSLVVVMFIRTSAGRLPKR